MKFVFVTGASGSGKTTLLKNIEQNNPQEFTYNYFDSIGVPDTDEMNRQYGSGDEWQRQTTAIWVGKMLTQVGDKVSILDGQMRLAYITEACNTKNVANVKIILVDCNDEVRSQRLIGRGQPELADPRMMNWAAFLRDEAEIVGATVLDTSEQDLVTSEARLLQLIADAV